MGSLTSPADVLLAQDQEFYEAFIEAHQVELRSTYVPECKWRTLCNKLRHSIFDTGRGFVYVEEETSGDGNSLTSDQPIYKVCTRCSMSPEDDESIFLIDHAWTYTTESAKKVLKSNPDLVKRMTNILNVSCNNDSGNEVIKSILENMWMFNDCYVLKNKKQESPIIDCWYILDEFGSRIQYAEDPSFMMVKFFYYGDSSMYSLLFPKKNVSENEEVTVSYPTFTKPCTETVKRALMYPWSSKDLTDIDFNLFDLPVDYYSSGRQEEILSESSTSDFQFDSSDGHQIAVFTEFPDVEEFLTHSSFKVVNKEEDAEIFWLATRQYNIRGLVETYPKFSFISQFPSEHVLVNKDLLGAVCRRLVKLSFNSENLESYPEWLPTTFNLETELPNFVSYFQHRQNRNLDNTWICKPFNLARGMGIYITDELNPVIRISRVRPMVASKYITDPVLFPIPDKGLVKMDLRYIVLLKDVKPLELYIYERFWLRFANKPFILDNFDDYETHFTVMNYNDFPLQQMFCHDFIQKFQEHYSSYKWCDIQEKINNMIKKIFLAATMAEPPAGLRSFYGSRAMYGLDIMLKWDRSKDVPDIVPMILEVNWMPDCKRAYQYYPEFYNDVFSVLFLGDIKDKHVMQL